MYMTKNRYGVAMPFIRDGWKQGRPPEDLGFSAVVINEGVIHPNLTITLVTPF